MSTSLDGLSQESDFLQLSGLTGALTAQLKAQHDQYKNMVIGVMNSYADIRQLMDIFDPTICDNPKVTNTIHTIKLFLVGDVGGIEMWAGTWVYTCCHQSLFQSLTREHQKSLAMCLVGNKKTDLQALLWEYTSRGSARQTAYESALNLAARIQPNSTDQTIELPESEAIQWSAAMERIRETEQDIITFLQDTQAGGPLLQLLKTQVVDPIVMSVDGRSEDCVDGSRYLFSTDRHHNCPGTCLCGLPEGIRPPKTVDLDLMFGV